LIDDDLGHTLVAASTLDKDIKSEVGEKTKTDVAQLVGQALAKRALSEGINKVVFDRGGYKYHGRVKALAETARKAGLDF
jgi:large subunit ribosomal protein L18